MEKERERQRERERERESGRERGRKHPFFLRIDKCELSNYRSNVCV